MLIERFRYIKKCLCVTALNGKLLCYCLLFMIGITEAHNVRRIYSNHVLPVIMDDTQWSKKPDSVLIAYLILIYKYLYAPEPYQFMNDMEKLKTQMIVKTHQEKFIRINSNENSIVHLTSFYGCRQSLDSLQSLKDQFLFISNDYYNQYQTELFFKDKERNLFIHFLNDLNIHEFFLVKPNERGKF